MSAVGAVGVVALSLTALTLLAPYGGRALAADGGPDVRTVYCLGSGHRADLASAAVRLRLVRSAPDGAADTVVPPGSDADPVSLERWARQHPADFARACDALMTADGTGTGATAAKDDDGDGGGGPSAFVQSVLLLLAGAVTTLLGQLVERTTAERRAHKQQLTTDLLEFRRIACLYLTAYESDPAADHDEVRRARETLCGTLALVPGRDERRRLAQLTAGRLPLAQPLPQSRDGALLLPKARRAESARALAALDRGTWELGSLARPAYARLLDRLPGRRHGEPGGPDEPGDQEGQDAQGGRNEHGTAPGGTQE